MSSYESAYKQIRVLNDAYIHSLKSDAPQIDQPADITVPLRAHQKSILYEMEHREKRLAKGMEIGEAELYSRFAFLGDGVGVGKSLMVLGHIARLKGLPTLKNIPTLGEYNSAQMYSLVHQTLGTDLSEVGCLIVVPHTLYRQWQGYIKDQTKLVCLGVQKKTVLEDPQFLTKLRAADCVLVSNTLYGGLQDKIHENKMLWKRVFYDEADTLHIPSTRPRPIARFSWLISASWSNLLFANITHFFTQSALFHLLNSPTFQLHPTLRNQLAQQTNQQQLANGHPSYIYTRYYMISSAFFRDFVGSPNPHRGRLLLRCEDDYVKESISLPPITIRNILCRPSVLQQVVAHAIPSEVRTLLHAGDVQGALQHLGVKPEQPMSLVQAVSENRLKELDRLRKTYDFKASLEYSTPQAKETALKSLSERIQHLETQIKELKERIENYKDEMCPICFDEPQTATLTPCCHRIFCAGCILTSLTRQATCPLCRTTIQASGLRSLGTNEAPAANEIVNPDEGPQPLKKQDQLLELIKANPQGRFLVFSRYDNPFTQITTEIEGLNITVKQVRGNKDVVASTLKSFQGGQTRVLLLHSLQAGAGLNITAATHVILLHAMTHEEEKQILGRAYRLGRKDPLEVIRLLHPDEMQHTHAHAH